MACDNPLILFIYFIYLFFSSRRVSLAVFLCHVIVPTAAAGPKDAATSVREEVRDGQMM